MLRILTAIFLAGGAALAGGPSHGPEPKLWDIPAVMNAEK
jgi:hypothetical protein